MTAQTGTVTITAEPVRSPAPYKFPKTSDGLLAWDWVDQRVAESHAYWLVTADQNGRPHATPVWGIWLDGLLYFDGHPHTRWSRNIAENPVATVHLESTDAVVILEGAVEDLTLGVEEGERVKSAWLTKYGRLEPDPSGSGILRLVPKRARAWSAEDLNDGTAFRFVLQSRR